MIRWLRKRFVISVARAISLGRCAGRHARLTGRSPAWAVVHHLRGVRWMLQAATTRRAFVWGVLEGYEATGPVGPVVVRWMRRGR